MRRSDGQTELRRIAAPDGKPITIRLLPFPSGSNVRGGTVATKGGYLVAIDSKRPRLFQRMSLGHELAHIFLGHFERERESLTTLEREARRQSVKYSLLYSLRLI